MSEDHSACRDFADLLRLEGIVLAARRIVDDMGDAIYTNELHDGWTRLDALLPRRPVGVADQEQAYAEKIYEPMRRVAEERLNQSDAP